MLLGVAAAFFLAALLCVLIYRRQRIQGGLPTGDLIYSDFSEQEARVLVSRRHGLKGKPDALVRTASGDVIPIERKKSRAPQRPYAGDLIQATAYCVLIEETYGRTPPFMRIQYADACFDEPYTPKPRTGFFRPVNKSGKRAAGELLIVLIQHLEDADRADSGRIVMKLYNAGGNENSAPILNGPFHSLLIPLYRDS